MQCFSSSIFFNCLSSFLINQKIFFRLFETTFVHVLAWSSWTKFLSFFFFSAVQFVLTSSPFIFALKQLKYSDLIEFCDRKITYDAQSRQILLLRENVFFFSKSYTIYYEYIFIKKRQEGDTLLNQVCTFSLTEYFLLV